WGPLYIMSGGRMVKRFDVQALLFIPGAGPQEQFIHHAFRIFWRGGEALSQPLREEVVVAIPAPLVVQRGEGQGGAREIGRGGLTRNRGIEHYGITQRRAEVVKDRGAQQELLNAFGLPLQNFFHQVIQHEMVAAGERADEAGRVWLSLQGKRS